jgi:hypothetical protein
VWTSVRMKPIGSAVVSELRMPIPAAGCFRPVAVRIP